MADKVKMSLDRYEEMKLNISTLEAENRNLVNQYKLMEGRCAGYEYLLSRISIPGEIIRDIDPDNIVVEKVRNPVNMTERRIIKIDIPCELFGG